MSGEGGNEELPVSNSVWDLVHKGLMGMIKRAITQADGSHFDAVKDKLGISLFHRLNVSLRHVAYGHGVRNDSVRHEVELAVDKAITDLNITDDANSTLHHTLVSRLDQQIEFDGFARAIERNTTVNWRAGDFFHEMSMKNEALFVWMVCTAVIVPIIVFTLFGIYIYKRKQETAQRREEMLLREQPEFSLVERSPTEHNGNSEEDVSDLDFRQAYPA